MYYRNPRLVNELKAKGVGTKNSAISWIIELSTVSTIIILSLGPSVALNFLTSLDSNEIYANGFKLKIAITGGLVILSSILIPVLAYLIKRKSAQSMALQQQVTIAFLESLEKSSFNPMSKRKVHG